MTDDPMAKSGMTTAARSDTGPTSAQIEAALDVLLRDIIAERRPHTHTRGRFTAVLFKDIRPDLRSRMTIAVDRIIEDPIDGPRYLAVQLLGERLGAVLGSTAGMQDAAERVADRDPANWGQHMAILDSYWNSIKARDGSVWRA